MKTHQIDIKVAAVKKLVVGFMVCPVGLCSLSDSALLVCYIWVESVWHLSCCAWDAHILLWKNYASEYISMD